MLGFCHLVATFDGLSEVIAELYELAELHKPWARVTFGDVVASPGARNTVPQEVKLSVDLRHPEQETLDEMDSQFREIAKRVSNQYGLQSNIDDEWNLPPVSFAQNCIHAVESSVNQLGYQYMTMVSGAGHDSGYLAQVAPTSMIFVPCEKGISHNEAENAKPEDLTAGCNVLFHAMLLTLAEEKM